MSFGRIYTYLEKAGKAFPAPPTTEVYQSDSSTSFDEFILLGKSESPTPINVPKIKEGCASFSALIVMVIGVAKAIKLGMKDNWSGKLFFNRILIDSLDERRVSNAIIKLAGTEGKTGGPARELLYKIGLGNNTLGENAREILKEIGSKGNMLTSDPKDYLFMIAKNDNAAGQHAMKLLYFMTNAKNTEVANITVFYLENLASLNGKAGSSARSYLGSIGLENGDSGLNARVALVNLIIKGGEAGKDAAAHLTTIGRRSFTAGKDARDKMLDIITNHGDSEFVNWIFEGFVEIGGLDNDAGDDARAKLSILSELDPTRLAYLERIGWKNDKAGSEARNILKNFGLRSDEVGIKAREILMKMGFSDTPGGKDAARLLLLLLNELGVKGSSFDEKTIDDLYFIAMAGDNKSQSALEILEELGKKTTVEGSIARKKLYELIYSELEGVANEAFKMLKSIAMMKGPQGSDAIKKLMNIAQNPKDAERSQKALDILKDIIILGCKEPLDTIKMIANFKSGVHARKILKDLVVIRQETDKPLAGDITLFLFNLHLEKLSKKKAESKHIEELLTELGLLENDTGENIRGLLIKRLETGSLEERSGALVILKDLSQSEGKAGRITLGYFTDLANKDSILGILARSALKEMGTKIGGIKGAEIILTLAKLAVDTEAPSVKKHALEMLSGFKTSDRLILDTAALLREILTAGGDKKHENKFANAILGYIGLNEISTNDMNRFDILSIQILLGGTKTDGEEASPSVLEKSSLSIKALKERINKQKATEIEAIIEKIEYIREKIKAVEKKP